MVMLVLVIISGMINVFNCKVGGLISDIANGVCK